MLKTTVRLGSVTDYFDYAAGLKMVKEAKWAGCSVFREGRPEPEMNQEYAIWFRHPDRHGGHCFRDGSTAGGSPGPESLHGGRGRAHCVANGELLRAQLFRNLWLQARRGGAGGAVGAALAASTSILGRRPPRGSMDGMKGASRTRVYDMNVELMAAEFGAVFGRFDEEGLCDKVAELLDGGFVVGWCEGRAEWGPRPWGPERPGRCAKCGNAEEARSKIKGPELPAFCSLGHSRRP